MTSERIVIIDEKNDDVMETIDLEDLENHKNCENFKHKIKLACREEGINPMLVKFVKKCLKLEDSISIYRILNLLLRIYKRVDHLYKQSKKFNKLLNKAIKGLNTSPSNKFAHIKVIYNSMKIYDTSNKCKRKNDAKNMKRHQPKKRSLNSSEDVNVIEIDDNVINLALECDQNTIILTSDEESSTPNISNRIIFEDTEFVGISNNFDKLDSNDINNQRLIHKIVQNDTVDIFSSESDDNEINKSNELQTNREVNILKKAESSELDITKQYKNIKETNLLTPVAWARVEKEMTAAEKIKNIENEIAVCKKEIAHYEMKEVFEDTKDSPYLVTSRLKAKVVSLYKQLCNLMGKSPVKRREVRLRVPEGFPSGPTRRLEKLLNNNISTDGNPPFPDFNDVVTCVKNANTSDTLGWNSERILRESQALFEQCGLALQRWRQKRDWGDVVSFVNKNELPDDPADKDPELLTKLMENRKLAITKENDVLQRYTNMQLNLTPVIMEMQESDRESEDDAFLKSDDIIEADREKDEEDREKEEGDTELPMKRVKLERINHSEIFANSLVIEISDSSDSDDDTL